MKKINKQFEYKLVQTVVCTEMYMNKLGASGWEVVCFTGNEFLFKREVQPMIITS